MIATQEQIIAEPVAETPPAAPAVVESLPKKFGLIERQGIIRQYLAAISRPGEVREIRILGVRQKYGKPITKSGFWEHAKLLNVGSFACGREDDAKPSGIYVTLNPVDTDLHSRVSDRIDKAENDSLAKDADVIKRTHVLIDVDPVRKSKISSSETEKLAARKVTGGIRRHLSDLGYPLPLTIDSGNGFHLIYRIDLPNDEDSTQLIKRFLHALSAKFDTAEAKVDTGVYNASRILKIAGTTARKGDSTTARPHRLAMILRNPDPFETVSRELLESVAAECPPEVKAAATARPAYLPVNGSVVGNYLPGDGDRVPGLIDRARNYIAPIVPAVEGDKGSNPTFSVCAKLTRGFAFSIPVAMQVIADWNSRCSPSWQDDELERKMREGFEKGTEPIGGMIGESKAAKPKKRKKKVFRLTAPAIPAVGDNSKSGEDEQAASSEQSGENATAIAVVDDHDAISRDEYPCLLMEQGRTEVANGRRLAMRYGRVFRYVVDWKSFVIWDGTRWKLDDGLVMEDHARTIFKAMFHELGQITQVTDDDSETEAILRFIKATGSRRGIEAMLNLARSEEGIPVTSKIFNQNPWLLNTPACTINLKTGETYEHRQEDFLTTCIPVAYDPTAICPTWERFLGDIFVRIGKETRRDDEGREFTPVYVDGELIDFIHRAVGYSLTGDVSEQALFFCFGHGSNGKSTFLGTIMQLLGGDYAIKAMPDLLLVKHGGNSTEGQQSDLYGKRFVATIEAESGRRMAESTLKELTGSDNIRARRLYQNSFEFSPTHKIWLAANHKPTVRGVDTGIWRRIKLIPFLSNFDAPDSITKKDKWLPEKLKNELPGILNWAIEGCRKWLEGGLQEPESVREATQEYRESEDMLGDFLAECCLLNTGFTEEAKELLNAFNQWSGEEWSAKKFGTLLIERGYEKFRNNGICYRGLKIK